MKKICSIFTKEILIVVAASIIGLLLMLAVFSIPTDRIEKNVIASVGIFEEEGTYPELDILGINDKLDNLFGFNITKLNITGMNSQLDNFTDALMLLNASYTEDTSVLDRAISVYRPNDENRDPAKTIVSYYTGGGKHQSESYAWYWHGYLVFLKPFLVTFTYGQIRALNVFFVIVLFLFLLFVMYRRGLKKYIVPYVISLFLIDPFAISQSLQFTTVYYIYTIASIVFLLKQDWLEGQDERLLLFFVIVGCATSFFDFLTYPLAAYGVPSTFYLCVSQKKFKETARVLLLTLLSWFVGYAGMWAGKWILGTLLGNENVIANAVSHIAVRTSMKVSSDETISVLLLIVKQLCYFITPAFVFAVIYMIIKARQISKEPLFDLMWILHIAVCLLPFVWYIVVSNHSYIHYWFTYRELIITAFSGMCIFARYADLTLQSLST